jgi:hypothetical protein
MFVTRALEDPRYVLPLCALAALAVICALVAGSSLRGHWGATTSADSPPPPPVTDSSRLQDLANVRAALALYQSLNGIYPSTVGKPQTLCQQESDAGCLLRSIGQTLRFDDGVEPYWYSSNGLGYTLYAPANSADHDHRCKGAVPAAFAGRPVLCVSGGVTQ